MTTRIFDLDAAAFATLRRLLDEALELEPSARARWLAELGSEHAALRERLVALLAHAADDGKLPDTLPKVGANDFASAEASHGAACGGVVGPYRLLRLLGEGGMGTVWLAERSDILQRRPIALKLPRLATHRPGLLERMAREREILAALDHPNVARLYDAGVAADGQPYLALEYIEGEPIDRYCAQRGLGIEARLRLFVQVARAVAHAHSRLVVHRDLKPANILVTANGEARLLDFGVAKLIGDDGDDSGLTQLTGRAMTPEYAAPEQILGRPIGTAADIYALGVVLYELLATTRPYRFDHSDLSRRAALEEAILRLDPPRPSEAAPHAVRRNLRGDLDTIALKALKKAPEERYRTADALADDIERHLAHQPVQARPDSGWYRARKFVARNRIAVGASTAVVLAVLSGSAVAVWQAQLARSEQRRAEEVKEFVTSIFEGADLYRGDGKPVLAADLLEQARGKVERTLASRPDLRLEMLSLIGYSLFNLQADVASAEALMRGAVADGVAALGKTHPLVLRAREIHSLTMRFTTTPDVQRQALAALIPDLRAAGGTLTAELARALESRAVLALTEARYQDAEADSREMLALASAKFGAEHPLALDAMQILASALLNQQRSTEALAIAERHYPLVLARHLGNARAPAAIEAGALYGRVLAQSGKLEDGVRQLERVLADAQATFGATSVGVGYTASNLARWQVEAGRIHAALASVEIATAALEKAPGRDSPAYARTLDQRAKALLAARRLPEAAAAFSETVAAFERARMGASTAAFDARAGRIEALARVGRRADAERELDALVASSAAGEGDARLLLVRGQVRRVQGDAAGARAVHEQALRTLAAQPNAAMRRAVALAEIGADSLAIGDLERAAAALREARSVARATLSTATPLVAEIDVALGRLHLQRSDPSAARPHLVDADAFWRGFDPAHRAAGEAAYWLARADEASGRSAEARAGFARAVAVLADSDVPGDAELAAAARRR